MRAKRKPLAASEPARPDAKLRAGAAGAARGVGQAGRDPRPRGRGGARGWSRSCKRSGLLVMSTLVLVESADGRAVPAGGRAGRRRWARDVTRGGDRRAAARASPRPRGRRRSSTSPRATRRDRDRRGRERPRQRGAGARRRQARPADGGQLHVDRRRRPGDGDARALGRQPARGGAAARLAGAADARRRTRSPPQPIADVETIALSRRRSRTPTARCASSSASPAAGGGVSLADADVVVSGGRGVGSAEGFSVIEELAALLGAAVGCSRAVTSAGWRPHSDQVGQTGTKISPEIYIACGISGATQHMAGCKGAKRLLAINPDGEASIFARADYGGDRRPARGGAGDQRRDQEGEGLIGVADRRRRARPSPLCGQRGAVRGPRRVPRHADPRGRAGRPQRRARAARAQRGDDRARPAQAAAAARCRG